MYGNASRPDPQLRLLVQLRCRLWGSSRSPTAPSRRAPPEPALSVFSLHATVTAMPPSKVLIAMTCVVAAACNYHKPRPSLAKPERGAQPTEGANPQPAAPAKVLRYAFVTMGRPAGGAELSIAADGTRTSYFAFND